MSKQCEVECSLCDLVRVQTHQIVAAGKQLRSVAGVAPNEEESTQKNNFIIISSSSNNSSGSISDESVLLLLL